MFGDIVVWMIPFLMVGAAVMLVKAAPKGKKIPDTYIMKRRRRAFLAGRAPW